VSGDAFVSSATVCRSAAASADVAENCTGSSAACPSDAKVASGTVCRSRPASATWPSLQRFANGCPTDAFVSSATVCRSSGGVCDVAENCTGSAAACPSRCLRLVGDGLPLGGGRL
jgi:hypothetical protein